MLQPFDLAAAAAAANPPKPRRSPAGRLADVQPSPFAFFSSWVTSPSPAAIPSASSLRSGGRRGGGTNFAFVHDRAYCAWWPEAPQTPRLNAWPRPDVAARPGTHRRTARCVHAPGVCVCVRGRVLLGSCSWVRAGLLAGCFCCCCCVHVWKNNSLYQNLQGGIANP